MGKITLDSVKLPCVFAEFMKKVPQESLENASIKIQSYLSEPEHKIAIEGYFKQCSIVKPELIKNIIIYRCERAISKIKNKGIIDLKKLYNSIMEEVAKKGLVSPGITVKGAEFIINNKSYKFVYHSPAKAVVLKYIDKKPIGKLKEHEVDALIGKDGDLNFAAPSHCTKVYKEVWECH